MRVSNNFQLLTDSRAFEDEVREAIVASQNSFYAQFMTFEGDDSGQRFAELMRQKAQDGLDVRLMVDYYTDVVLSDVYPFLIHRRGEVQRERRKTLSLFEDLQANGVGVQRTAPFGRLGQYFLFRNHKKMVVLDEHVAFVGGINVSDHNYEWHDFMVRIEGPLVKDLVRDFCSTWDGQTVPFDTAKPGQDFILNQRAGRYSIFEEILAIIHRAKETVVIESPYLLGDHIETALYHAAQRGVQVTVIMPYRSNKFVYRLWVRDTKRRLQHPNITIYGYRGNGGMTHAKLVLVDDRWATFGSLNLMELEGLTQKELNIFTSNQQLIAQLREFVEQDVAQSVILKTPRHGWGRFSYTLLYHGFNWWTQRLIQNEAWRAVYC
jgi:cardiolipin synthase